MEITDVSRYTIGHTQPGKREVIPIAEQSEITPEERASLCPKEDEPVRWSIAPHVRRFLVTISLGITLGLSIGLAIRLLS